MKRLALPFDVYQKKAYYLLQTNISNERGAKDGKASKQRQINTPGLSDGSNSKKEFEVTCT